MNTSNSQAGAEQARIYRDAVTSNTPVPEAMRAMAEKVVDRSREAYDRSKDALDASVVTFERLRRCRPRRCGLQPQIHRHDPAQRELRF